MIAETESETKTTRVGADAEQTSDCLIDPFSLSCPACIPFVIFAKSKKKTCSKASSNAILFLEFPFVHQIYRLDYGASSCQGTIIFRLRISGLELEHDPKLLSFCIGWHELVRFYLNFVDIVENAKRSEFHKSKVAMKVLRNWFSCCWSY